MLLLWHCYATFRGYAVWNLLSFFASGCASAQRLCVAQIQVKLKSTSRLNLCSGVELVDLVQHRSNMNVWKTSASGLPGDPYSSATTCVECCVQDVWLHYVMWWCSQVLMNFMLRSMTRSDRRVRVNGINIYRNKDVQFEKLWESEMSPRYHVLPRTVTVCDCTGCRGLKHTSGNDIPEVFFIIRFLGHNPAPPWKS